MSQPLGFQLRDIGHEKLLRYAELLLRHYRLVDAYWFLKVEDNFGLDVAQNFNEEIWEKLSQISAKDIIKYMDVKSGNLKNMVEALKYFPWTVIATWKIVKYSDKRVVIKAERCPPQEARVRNGRKIFACKTMEKKFFENFAKIFHKNIKVKCHHAPPDPKPQSCWCTWEFILDRQE